MEVKTSEKTGFKMWGASDFRPWVPLPPHRRGRFRWTNRSRHEGLLAQSERYAFTAPALSFSSVRDLTNNQPGKHRGG